MQKYETLFMHETFYFSYVFKLNSTHREKKKFSTLVYFFLGEFASSQVHIVHSSGDF